MFSKFFKSKNDIHLIQKNEELLSEVEYLKNELNKKEALIKCKTDFVIETEKFQKNSKQVETLVQENEQLTTQNLELQNTLSKIDQYIPLYFFDNTYFVPLDIYFHEARFHIFIDELAVRNIYFVQQINENIINEVILNSKLNKEIKERYNNFLEKKVSWNVKTFLLKGEKISKYYNKSRKFMNTLSSYGIEYMSEISPEIFKTLDSSEFSTKDVILFKGIYLEYISTKQIKE